ncbi:MAG: hypothetical protein KAZ17_00380 [Sphingorhabdus sp.]|nr:hypothetical protein [Sphingorhabdus sp.]
MDNLRGFGPLNAENDADDVGFSGDFGGDDSEMSEHNAIEAPPAIGSDERRMQVRAYNFWTSQLHDRNYPGIEELDPETVDDFREYSVLLDFTSGIENPSIPYLGSALRSECGLGDDISYLDQVPARSLLSRITDHYLQIIANRAPIGFEAEFVNDRGLTIMYRGILLPYSSDDDTIDFIYGVINWKEAASNQENDALQKEVAASLKLETPRLAHVPVWADGPAAGHFDDDLLELDEAYVDTNVAHDHAGEMAFADEIVLGDDAGLADWLVAARNTADAAKADDARSRDTLYRAIGRAYDFSLVAEKHSADFGELLADSGLKAQARAPMTPITKLVFGAGYDKTRLTEYAAALNYAHRNAVPMGMFSDMIARHDGGLKGIVKAERQARKVMKGAHVQAIVDPRDMLRLAATRPLSGYDGAGEEFIILVARRDADGTVAIVGNLAGDAPLTEKVLANAAK